ncbi:MULTISPECIES: HlyD family secretion protein [Prochlorococcus]|uniref:HlyD family secretion protein n=1 Tax=Prochlorococcus TaxID=1218 RepID=UPI0007B3BB22|nr:MULTISPECIES: HlyD family efflux transporter periplasmic adaptor subunit [Prochlorococcus]NMP05472.1 HlyD family efflux transporter periplasmic adaptor subunit [Prochlorococcus sp. P1361]NMP13050.1 HlyD family efflux transporter periplasmic adaptor subunit [Prochlorococcus sp.P1363]
MKKPSDLLKNAQNSLESFFNERDEEGEVIRQSPIWMRATTWGLMSTAVFAIGWLTFAETDEVVTVSGKLEPLGSVQEIQMPLGGIASEILVKDGEEVEAGQVVMRLDKETIQQQHDSFKESFKLKNNQLEFKKTELEQYLLLNDEEVKMLKQNLALQKQILSSYKKLSEQGATAELQYLQQLSRVAEVNGKLNQSLVDRKREKAVQAQNIQQLKAESEQLQAKITEASVNLRYQAIRSPIAGIVFDLKPSGKGYVAKGTETLMKIVPYETLEARVEIPSNQIGFVKVGMPAEISIDSFPATDFGVLEGQVKSIGSDALAPNQQENRQEYRYPAMIKLENQKLKLKNGNQLPLQVGMSLTSNIKLRKVSYLKLLLGSFQNKVDSLRQL